MQETSTRPLTPPAAYDNNYGTLTEQHQRSTAAECRFMRSNGRYAATLRY